MAKKRGRKGNGEGSIYQRQSGVWVAALSLGWDNGKRRRKEYTGKTRAEVSAKLRKALADLQDGKEPSPETQTVGAFLRAWLDDVAKPSVRPARFARYQDLALRHILPDLGRVRLRKLTPQRVQQFLDAKGASGLSPRTVDHLRAVLRNALNTALRWQHVSLNAAELADPPRVESRERPSLTVDQAQQFLRATAGDRLHALYLVALALGLRQGEALGLRWADVDLEARTLRIGRALQRIGGKPQFVEPKTVRSRRTLPMPAFLVAPRAHRDRQLDERILAGARWQEQDLVFPTTVGTPLDGPNVTHRLQAAMLRAKLPRLRFHDLRHSCASLLVAAGLHPPTIMETLGHSQIGVTDGRLRSRLAGLAARSRGGHGTSVVRVPSDGPDRLNAAETKPRGRPVKDWLDQWLDQTKNAGQRQG